ncbi:MAG: ATP-binding protein, partial [Desulfobacterales bacterium]|nr:ATP-binding protein [Desulfobacterales bacterium]
LARTREVFLDVLDQGPGIASRHLSQVTDPFFTTRREAGGTGLGLSVSAGIAEEHGGRIEFDSELGQGTRARLVLPAEKEC